MRAYTTSHVFLLEVCGHFFICIYASPHLHSTYAFIKLHEACEVRDGHIAKAEVAVGVKIDRHIDKHVARRNNALKNVDQKLLSKTTPQTTRPPPTCSECSSTSRCDACPGLPSLFQYQFDISSLFAPQRHSPPQWVSIAHPHSTLPTFVFGIIVGVEFFGWPFSFKHGRAEEREGSRNPDLLVSHHF